MVFLAYLMAGSTGSRGAAANFLSKFSRKRHPPSFVSTASSSSSATTSSRLFGLLSHLTAESETESKNVDNNNNHIHKESLLPVTSSSLTVAGTIPLRQFQHRSISFWSWRAGGGEEDEEERENDTKQDDGNKSSKNKKPVESESSKKKRQQRKDKVSYSSEQGFRTYMEDEYYISKDGDFCCCFDGHGGRAVSRYLKKNLYANVQAFLPASALPRASGNDDALVDETQAAIDGLITTVNRAPATAAPTVDDYALALESALDKIDKEILRISHWSFQGSTAVIVWLLQDHSDDEEKPKRTILAANIGDSRAVLCRKDTAWDLTRDHKPNDPVEKERIESIGGSVIWCGDVDYYGNPIEERGIYRVNGNLALSRAIGDRAERPHVSATSDMVAVDVEEGDEFIVVATDGLWDVMDSAEAVSYVKFVLESGLSKEKVAAQMVQEALRRGTFDNITVLIIWL
jgi:serine/threonine protein phosphatase PrpC